jgi:hypothetical protein
MLESTYLRTIAELAGESLREMGILLVVFVPLDAAFHQGELSFATIVALGVVVLAGLALLVGGILLEEG